MKFQFNGCNSLDIVLFFFFIGKVQNCQHLCKTSKALNYATKHHLEL